MNHDYAHCLDWDRDKCPKNCFRYELMDDLKRKDVGRLILTWTHFEGSQECMKKENR